MNSEPTLDTSKIVDQGRACHKIKNVNLKNDLLPSKATAVQNVHLFIKYHIKTE